MKGVLVRLLALSSLKHIDINMKLVKGVVREMIGENEFHSIGIREISKYITSKI